MGKNKEIGVKIKGKKNLKKVDKIDYTPQTMAAAIAKNLRAEIELRDMPIKWDQARWGLVSMENLTNPAQSVNINITENDPWGNDGELRTQKYVGVTCPTTGCIAGWAVSLAGAVMVVTQDEIDDYKQGYSGWQTERIVTNKCYRPGMPDIEEIPEVAEKLLGLDFDQRVVLFSERRTEREVLAILDTIATGGVLEEMPGWEWMKS